VEALCRDRVEHRAALGNHRRHRDDLVTGAEHLAKERAPLLQREAEEAAAVEVEQVEGEVRQRPPGLAGEPARQLLPVEPARLVDDHDPPSRTAEPDARSARPDRAEPVPRSRPRR
jgi:hypothetical protein